jgi:dTDP-4-dehydrorhamnose 3,5-epimerase
MKVINTFIPEVIIFEPPVFCDSRGHFQQTFHEKLYREAGVPKPFVQDNQTYSIAKVLRGLHFQLAHPQGKLVRATKGEVFDVAVDLRKNSPTFGQWHGEILSAENRRQMYVPENFAHGFCVLGDCAEFLYKCTDFYHPGDEVGLIWNDAEVGVKWPIDDPLLSDKDQKLPTLAEVMDVLPTSN